MIFLRSDSHKQSQILYQSMSNESSPMDTTVTNISPESFCNPSAAPESIQSIPPTTVRKTRYSIQPIAEGPLVKPKRQLSEKQLKALEQGRKRLAETRRNKKSASVTLSTVEEEQNLIQEDLSETPIESKPLLQPETEKGIQTDDQTVSQSTSQSTSETQSNDTYLSDDDVNDFDDSDYKVWCSIS